MQRRQHAFTLLELTISIAIVAITSLSVAGVTMAISSAHASTEGYYQSIQTGRGAIVKIQNIVQGSKLVTFCNSGTIALWLNDTNGDNAINMDEIGVIVFSSGQVQFYREYFPSNLQLALNGSATLQSLTSATALVPQITTSNYAPPQVLATDVSGCTFSASPPPPMATLVKIKMTIGQGTAQLTLRSAASTRAGSTAKVGMSGGQYVLIGS